MLSFSLLFSTNFYFYICVFGGRTSTRADDATSAGVPTLRRLRTLHERDVGNNTKDKL